MAMYNKRTVAKMEKLRATIKEGKKMKELEAKLKEELLVAFNEDGLQNVPMDYGTFYIKKTPVWSFSDAVEALKEKLKTRKAKEQKNGVATVKETESIGFRPSKV